MDVLLGLVWEFVRPYAVWVMLAAGVVVGGLAGRWRTRRSAVREERAEQKERDREHADDIRDRISRDRSDAVRKLDDAGYRD